MIVHPAQDRLGHATEVSSQPVTYDNSPPSQGQVLMMDMDTAGTALSPATLHVYWEGIVDRESGVARQEISIASSEGRGSAVAPSSEVQGTSSVLLNVSDHLADGHSYLVSLKVS